MLQRPIVKVRLPECEVTVTNIEITNDTKNAQQYYLEKNHNAILKNILMLIVLYIQYN